MKNYKIAVAGTGYVGLSIATLLSQHHQVTAVDIIPEKVDMINNRKSPIQDDYIEKYLAEKELNLTATLDAKPDVIHTNGLYDLSTIVWEAAYKKKIKIVHTLRDYHLLCPLKKILWQSGKIAFCFSVSIEMLQLSLRLGTFQLSDIFYNTVGGVLGGLMYCAVMKARKRL